MSLTSHDMMQMFFALGILLASARILGEAAKRLKLPEIFGEILAGILLGKTVLSSIFPEFGTAFFPDEGPRAAFLEGLIQLAIALYLLVAGMEVDLTTIWRQGRNALRIGLGGILVCFSLGFLVAYAIPDLLMGRGNGTNLQFSLFFATALSIAALPVIAKTLIDLGLYRSDLGMVVIAAAVFNDVLGWSIFAVLLGMIGQGADTPPLFTIVATIVFAGFMLTVGRWLIDKALPWIQARTSWPGGVIGFSLSLALLAAGLTELIGLHAIFGTFLVGIAIGESKHLREQTRITIDKFISFFFAPLFFASIGLHINFIHNFDPLVVFIVLAVASVGMIFGAGGTARLIGMSKRESWAVGFAMNARGAMEIILGSIALSVGLIGNRLFVALVVMAIVTSMVSGPAIQRLMRLRKPRRVLRYLTASGFVRQLKSRDAQGVIRELASAIEDQTALDQDEIVRAVWEREKLQPTGLEYGLAVPHARLSDLSEPVVAVGITDRGIDFDAPDGENARIIFLLLTPEKDDGSQLELLADIARTFSSPNVRDRVLRVENFMEFAACLKIQGEKE